MDKKTRCRGGRRGEGDCKEGMKEERGREGGEWRRRRGSRGRGGICSLREADWGGGASIIEGGLVYWCGL
jgi:hypothetical protein